MKYNLGMERKQKLKHRSHFPHRPNHFYTAPKNRKLLLSPTPFRIRLANVFAFCLISGGFSNEIYHSALNAPSAATLSEHLFTVAAKHLLELAFFECPLFNFQILLVSKKTSKQTLKLSKYNRDSGDFSVEKVTGGESGEFFFLPSSWPDVRRLPRVANREVGLGVQTLD